MANKTDPAAKTLHGTNPQYLIEKIVRSKIYASLYWKEYCFALTAETLLERAAELRHVGGTFGGQQKPTHFMCLLLKLLQIQPEKDIIVEFIMDDTYKYLRLLGAFYLRLTGQPVEIYGYLEPLFNDFRRVRVRQRDGTFALSHVDEVVSNMLHKDILFDIALPRLPSRHILEQLHSMPPRISVLDQEFDEAALEAEADKAKEAAAKVEKEMRQELRHRSRSHSSSPRPRSISPRKRERPGRYEARDGERRREPDDDRRRRYGDREQGRSDMRRREDEDRRRRQETDRDRLHRQREYEKDRDRERERGRDRDREHRRRERDDRDDREERQRDRDDDRGGRDRGRKDEEAEIAEQNELRARLGLKPLR